MRQMRSLSLVFLALAVSVCTASAATIVDQNQPSSTAAMARFNQTDLAQSFQQSFSNISGAGIFLSSGFGTGGDVTISLYDALPNAGGILLTSGTAAGTPGAWVDVFWAPVVVTPSTTLFLVFTSTDDQMIVAGDINNPYAFGQVYANPGYGPFPGYDYAFRTYADDNLNPVPEPSTITLLLGAIGLLAVGRRRKA